MEIIQGTTALFENPEMGVSVLPIVSPPLPISLAISRINKASREAELDPAGKLKLSPQEVKQTTGFQLVFRIPKKAPIVVVQRNLSRENPDEKNYHNSSLITQREDEWDTFVMMDHVRVMRENGMSWTRWRGEVPNRVDFWDLRGNQIRLFQVGVIARGYGDDTHFRILGELRGEWDLYRSEKRGIVGVPTNSEWGDFDVRGTILDNEEMKALLTKVTLPVYRKSPAIAPIKHPTGLNRATVQWWSPFAGRRGQGPCTLTNGSSAWICGEDLLVDPDQDGIVRLSRGTIVSYEDIHTERDDHNSLTKLLRVSRA
jgi:hypothetical protein